MAQVNDDTIECPKCGEEVPYDGESLYAGGSRFYCWTCDLFYCPICMNGTDFFGEPPEYPAYCQHYVASCGSGGDDPDFIDFVRGGEAMANVVTKEDLERHDTWEWELLERASQKMEDLSVEEKVQHFGSLYPLWEATTIFRLPHVEEVCDILGIPLESASLFGDFGCNSYITYYTKIGGAEAWQRITPAVKQYKEGLAWLEGYAR